MDNKVLREYRRGASNKNGERLLKFAGENELAVVNTVLHNVMGGVPHTLNISFAVVARDASSTYHAAR